MIVADTNVWSEPFRQTPEPRVLVWLQENAGELAVTTVSVAELLFGAQRLPEGRRQASLLDGVDHLIRNAGDRLLVFDEAAARAAAKIRVAREAAGRPTSTEDLMIAAIASSRGASVATRNLRDFEGFGIDVVNPWLT